MQNEHVEIASAKGRSPLAETPNDTLYTQQWAHSAMNSAAAWNISTGNDDVIIALIDTGMDLTHPDLAPNLWEHPDSVGVHGYNFVDSTWVPNHEPGDNHGTRVAGVFGAVTNNTAGVAGIAGGWAPSQAGARIMVLRAGSDDPGLCPWEVLDAIIYARSHKVNIINCSFRTSALVRSRLEWAYKDGILVVAASGNAAHPDSLHGAREPSILSVNGIAQDYTKQAGSPWGIQVDVSAPGDNIYTTNPAVSETLWVNSPGGSPSLATAHVSGLGALLFSYLGTNTPVDQIYATIKYSTDYITGTPDYSDAHWGLVGTGTINNYQALQMAQNTIVVPTDYGTISAAMDAATSGTIVYVRPGTYNESVSLKSGVRLVASRSDVTTINGTVSFNGISNAEIAGFTISKYQANVDVFNSTDVLIRNCRITDGNLGVYVNYANPKIRHCEIFSNGTGLYLGTGAGTSVTVQNSRISHNNRGLFAQSTPNLNNRRNSVNRNTTYHIEATAGSGFIDAQTNWWGSSPPNTNYFSTVNGVSLTPHLTYDPIPASHTPPKAVATRFTESAPIVQDSEEIRQLYRQGRAHFEDGSVEIGIELFQQLVEQSPEARLARVALKELVAAWHQLGAPEKARSYLQAVRAQGLASPLQLIARRLEFDLHVLERKYEDALIVAQEIDDELSGTEIAEEVAFEVAQLWMFVLNRPEGVQKLRDYLASYPAQAGHEQRQIRRQAAHVLLGESLQEEPGEKVVVGASLALEVEGPNPFNAHTVVTFYLPGTSKGSLVIYNSLGQLVRTLVPSSSISSGTHRVVWDGMDNQSRPTGSGVYIVHLQADGESIARKITLLR